MLEVVCGDKTIHMEALPGEMLSRALWLSGQLPTTPLCNGLGRCGCCRVRFMVAPPPPVSEDLAYFGDVELGDGWRLACHHRVPENEDLRLELPPPHAPCQRYAMPEIRGARAFLGVDLGTTSVQWRLHDASGGTLAEGSFWNPQGGAGADIISRLQAAACPGGLKLLSDLVRASLSSLVMRLDHAGAQIERACVAANSVMTEIFLGADISGLLAAPWSLSTKGGEVLDLPLGGAGRELPTVVPPLPAPFVGGDVSAGLWALLSRDIPRPFLLIDMGTNAEVALYTEDGHLWLTSAPLGPALEGIGPCCGQPAGAGVITKFSLGPAGLIPHFYQDVIPESCCGISATGYISLLAILLNVGAMSSDGGMGGDVRPMPIARKVAQGMVNGRLSLPFGQYLTSLDVEILLKVKAALAVAVSRLFTASGIDAMAIKQLAIAGSLGEFARISDLATLGFIPAACASRAVSVGNSSLDGACLLAATPGALPELAAICQRAHVLNLAEGEQFLDSYLEAMHWGF